MQWINAGVIFPENVKPTKKALKELLKADPDKVVFYGTSAFGPSFHGTINDIPPGASLQVVGPDPYSKRDWYANVTVEGKVT